MGDFESDTRFTLNTLGDHAWRELQRQYSKWGPQDHTPGDWWLIVSEEFGEPAKATLEGNSESVLKEASHLIACIARFVEKVARDGPHSGWAAEPA